MKHVKAMLVGAMLALAPAATLAQTAGTAPASAVANPAAAQSEPQSASTPSPSAIANPDTGVAPVTGAAPMAAPAPIGQATATPPAPPLVAPTPGIGMPTDKIGLQPQFTAIGENAAWMHDIVLMPVITAISLLVLVLLLWVIVRFRRAANPIPSKTTHHTWLEVTWTLLPVLILLLIAVPSIKLLARQYSPPRADLTVKVIGNQWYWSYQYPDNGDFEVVSNMLKDKDDPTRSSKERARTDADGPRLLAVDERMVVPAGAVVKIITTSADVIHSFAVPAFWTKMDAVPGRLNETWFKVDRPGVYFGQCSELCGPNHGYMPIAVEVVPQAQFAAWVASKGGTMPGAAGASNPDATATSPTTNPTAGAAPADNSTAVSDATVNATTPATATRQGATANQ